MKKQIVKNFSILASLAALTAVVGACGSSNNTVPVVSGNGGLFPGCGGIQCNYGGGQQIDFPTWCAYQGGGIVAAMDGTSVCRIAASAQIPFVQYNQAFALGPNAFRNSPLNTGVALSNGDRLIFQNVSGKWGSSYSFGNCQGGAHANDPSTGLYGTDGSANLFQVLSNTETPPLNAGSLSLGFNVPNSFACTELTLSFQWIRCIDANNLTHACAN